MPPKGASRCRPSGATVKSGGWVLKSSPCGSMRDYGVYNKPVVASNTLWVFPRLLLCMRVLVAAELAADPGFHWCGRGSIGRTFRVQLCWTTALP